MQSARNPSSSRVLLVSDRNDPLVHSIADSATRSGATVERCNNAYLAVVRLTTLPQDVRLLIADLRGVDAIEARLSDVIGRYFPTIQTVALSPGIDFATILAATSPVVAQPQVAEASNAPTAPSAAPDESTTIYDAVRQRMTADAGVTVARRTPPRAAAPAEPAALDDEIFGRRRPGARVSVSSDELDALLGPIDGSSPGATA